MRMRILILGLTILSVSPVLADEPYVTVPSGLNEGAAVSLTVGNLEAGQSVWVDLIAENGRHEQFRLLADEELRASAPLDSVPAGTYRVYLYSEAGIPLANTLMVIAPD